MCRLYGCRVLSHTHTHTRAEALPCIDRWCLIDRALKNMDNSQRTDIVKATGFRVLNIFLRYRGINKTDKYWRIHNAFQRSQIWQFTLKEDVKSYLGMNSWIYSKNGLKHIAHFSENFVSFILNSFSITTVELKENSTRFHCCQNAWNYCVATDLRICLDHSSGWWFLWDFDHWAWRLGRQIFRH